MCCVRSLCRRACRRTRTCSSDGLYCTTLRCTRAATSTCDCRKGEPRTTRRLDRLQLSKRARAETYTLYTHRTARRLHGCCRVLTRAALGEARRRARCSWSSVHRHLFRALR